MGGVDDGQPGSGRGGLASVVARSRDSKHTHWLERSSPSGRRPSDLHEHFGQRVGGALRG